MAKKNIPPSLRNYLKKLAKKGGKARAAKYSAKKLSEWGERGGRPRKTGKKK